MFGVCLLDIWLFDCLLSKQRNQNAYNVVREIQPGPDVRSCSRPSDALPCTEQFWLHPRSGPRVHRTRSAGLSRVHRTCPIYFLGPSSFRRCAFEALKRAKKSMQRPWSVRDFRSLRARDAPSREQFGQQSVFYLCVLGSRPAAASSRSVVSHGDGGRVCATPAHFP